MGCSNSIVALSESLEADSLHFDLGDVFIEIYICKNAKSYVLRFVPFKVYVITQ